MVKENQRTLNFFLLISDVVCLVLAFLVAFLIWFYCIFPNFISLLDFFIDYVPFLLLLSVFSELTLYGFGLYSARRNKSLLRELFLLLCSISITFFCVLALMYLGGRLYPSGFLLLFLSLYGLAQCGSRCTVRLVLRYIRKKGYNQKYLLLIGDGELARQFIHKVRSNPRYGYRFYGCLTDHAGTKTVENVPVTGTISSIAKHLESGHVDEVVVALGLDEYDKMEFIIAHSEKCGIKVNVIPAFFQYLPSNPRMDEFDGIPFMVLRKIPLSNPWRAFLKRSFDIAGAACCLILTSPLLLLTAIVLRLTVEEVIFHQERVGRNLKPFVMYKFRTMTTGEGQAGWTRKNDPRRTRFGVFLRKFSIDELPQFLNVLKGEMSIVGPRPEIGAFVRQFKETIPRYMVRHQVKPGITGWAQVNNLRGDTSIEERIKSDIYYIENWSLSWDIRIVIKTITKAFYNPNE